MEKENLIIPSEYSDICPIQDKDFHNEMSILVNEPMFKQVLQVVMPQYNYTQLKMLLLSLNSKYDLQTKFMKPFIDGLLAKTSKGLT
ncbi:MAG: acyltransferase, partial [Muribaculaceae bacterium]|nr:acyltransferase [Muribaculaceae bacterium]